MFAEKSLAGTYEQTDGRPPSQWSPCESHSHHSLNLKALDTVYVIPVMVYNPNSFSFLFVLNDYLYYLQV